MVSSAQPDVGGLTAASRIDERAVDSRLLWLVARGERDALAAIYDLHARAAYALADRICSAAGAQDAVAEAFLRLWRQIRAGQGGGSTRVRVLRLTRQCALDRLRAGDRRAPPKEDAAPCMIEPGTIELYERHAHSALAAMPPVARECIELAYFDGLSVAETAVRCQLSPTVVKLQLRTGMHQMLGYLTSLPQPDIAPAQ